MLQVKDQIFDCACVYLSRTKKKKNFIIKTPVVEVAVVVRNLNKIQKVQPK